MIGAENVNVPPVHENVAPVIVSSEASTSGKLKLKLSISPGAMPGEKN
jgi:hypothetical protein